MAHKQMIKFIFLLVFLFFVGSICSFAIYAPLLRPAAPNYYEILNLQPDATSVEIKKAFRLASKQLHPDRVVGDDEDSRLDASRKFIQATEAFETLRDAKKRYWYDLSLKSEEFFSFWSGCFTKIASGNGKVAQLLSLLLRVAAITVLSFAITFAMKLHIIATHTLYTVLYNNLHHWKIIATHSTQCLPGQPAAAPAPAHPHP